MRRDSIWKLSQPFTHIEYKLTGRPKKTHTIPLLYPSDTANQKGSNHSFTNQNTSQNRRLPITDHLSSDQRVRQNLHQFGRQND